MGAGATDVHLVIRKEGNLIPLASTPKLAPTRPSDEHEGKACIIAMHHIVVMLWHP